MNQPPTGASPYIQDTIAARATAQGRGGIGIVRVSGPLVPEIALQVMGKLPPPRQARLGDFLDADGCALDQGLTLYFPGPDSFTGEDVLEFQGHGGPVVLDLLLRRILALGARVAKPGEFSQRAFLNDKLDLAQAEALADLINAGSEAAARGALRSLQGDFSRLIDQLVAEVIALRVEVEAAIDFPDEGLDPLAEERIDQRLDALEARIQDILQQAGQGALLVEGAAVVLAGKPNAGKSSLMNRLTGQDTSIITDIPGTTRDLVDAQVQLGGIPLRMTDTAGLRHSHNEIEAEGVRRATAALATADLVLLVLDATLDAPLLATQIAELREDAGPSSQLIVLNKIDLLAQPLMPQKGDFAGAMGLSCKTGEGLEALQEAMLQQLGSRGAAESNFTARRRHLTALQRATEALARARSTEQAWELVAEELRSCQADLSEITGAFGADDLLGEIFSHFCIGK